MAGPLRATAGPGKTFSREPQIFSRGLYGKKFLNFFLKMAHSGVGYFIFLADGGASKRRNVRGSLPPTPPSERAWLELQGPAPSSPEDKHMFKLR